MSKVKAWLWDEAEKAVDELITKVKSGESVPSGYELLRYTLLVETGPGYKQFASI